jgi:hypothetical protein
MASRLIGVARKDARDARPYNRVMAAEAERAWLENWRLAGPELEDRRRLELRRLTPERARFLSDAALALVGPRDASPARRAHSGLVEQQELFAPLRRR